ncbi:MAG TPA: preprotein translocase subunit SecY [Clostridia bacterium]|nr:preprotein translocase subunit SecY [Clostridia bacterium]HQO68965.1 preprotein translocase subunit SecY [Clostridia bacterium]
MFQTIKNAWNIPELRKKILFTIAMLLIYRIGCHLPVPGLIGAAFEVLVEGNKLFGFMDMFSGGAFSNMSLFAMNIQPYINASIILNLLTIAIPALERLAKEGEEGRKKITQYTRYLTIGLGLFQASMLFITLKNYDVLYDGGTIMSFLTVVFTFCAGTAIVMWLGELITDKGIGNGISMIIFVGIISRIPTGAAVLYASWQNGKLGATAIETILLIVGLLVVMLGMIVGTVYVSGATRKIPVNYAKKVVGRKMYGGQSTHIPMQVNMSGVMPIIFASSITTLPSIIINFVAPNTENKFLMALQKTDSWGFLLIYAALIFFFSFFYTMISFNPVEVSNNLKKNGGFVPGIRPGKPTAEYLAYVLNKITWFGGLFLALLATIPAVLARIVGIQIGFGGSALLIVVGVALETVKQMESQMLMRHYKGFLD